MAAISQCVFCFAASCIAGRFSWYPYLPHGRSGPVFSFVILGAKTLRSWTAINANVEEQVKTWPKTGLFSGEDKYIVCRLHTIFMQLY